MNGIANQRAVVSVAVINAAASFSWALVQLDTMKETSKREGEPFFTTPKEKKNGENYVNR